MADSIVSPALENGDDSVPEGFDEVAYAEAYPDVAMAVRSGLWKSALHHYRMHGEAENRLADHRYVQAAAGGSTAYFPPASVDRGYVTRSGQCLISGWVADTQDATLRQIVIRQGKKILATSSEIARLRRDDASGPETAIHPRLLGFWALAALEAPFDPDGEFDVVLFAGANRRSYTIRLLPVLEEELRDIALRLLVSAKYFGDAETETFYQLDKGIGSSLIRMNSAIVSKIAVGGYTERFGARRPAYSASIVVVLFGDADYLTLQAALFSKCPGYEEHEFIYVSNSMELSEVLIKNATTASKMYSMAITLILLPGNAGFGVACNAGAAAATSDRIIFLNPDVLPREDGWVQRHAEIIAQKPAAQTAIFGVPLYYCDGSLMHGGMYTEIVGGCSVQGGKMLRRQIVRVQHYGKGAPPETPEYLRARPVTAVSGAFMSFEREWFERLGGFSTEFIFGHYEDVDLCFRSLEQGFPAWLHPVSFWHMESKGSKHAPVHDGGRLVNRWNLSTTWGELVKSELAGKSPAYFNQ